MPPEAPVTNELARAMAALAVETNRGVSILLDRRGRVITVAIGDAADTPLPPLVGEADARLHGLRLVHTHQKAGGFSPADLTTLFVNRLDAMVVFRAAAGSAQKGGRNELFVDDAFIALISPKLADEEDWQVEGPMPVAELERLDVLARVRALEEELQREAGAREATRTAEERAVLVGLYGATDGAAAEDRMAELAELVRSAGADVAATSLQHKPRPDARTLVGEGKLGELVSLAFHEDADLLVFDRELAPAQAREIERVTQLRVLDRTQVILDIFAQNARGREAQVQVELAQLHYQLPRLAGRGRSMSRLGGGIGTRGPGETKLEVDRRRIRERIKTLEAAVGDISRRRGETRKSRTRSGTPVVALVGYTNAGKSTLFNALAKADASVRNQLFETLRPTSREGWLPGLGEYGAKVVYTDTVGFIRDLPSELVNAFRATLEELHDADLLLHVVDAASPGAPDRVEAVGRILDELNLEPPRMIVLNKADAADPQVLHGLSVRYDAVPVSAVRHDGLEELKVELAAALRGGPPPGFAGAAWQPHDESIR